MACVKSNRKNLLRKKDGEIDLDFASCPPNVQAARRESRHTEWKHERVSMFELF